MVNLNKLYEADYTIYMESIESRTAYTMYSFDLKNIYSLIGLLYVDSYNIYINNFDCVSITYTTREATFRNIIIDRSKRIAFETTYKTLWKVFQKISMGLREPKLFSILIDYFYLFRLYYLNSNQNNKNFLKIKFGGIFNDKGF